MCLQAKDERSAMEEKYRNELNAHVKLSSLYKVRETTKLLDLMLVWSFLIHVSIGYALLASGWDVTLFSVL